ncbi:MAG: 16S rRNA (uracil(1498)-N(3))-methyltransferase [Firmicutes bacterium]|nr:16S rRNA (uracil(1498)-N(3))-methyltransferase [Bacillota bacterium]
MKRFFVQEQLGYDLVMDGMEHNHLANVLRCRVDEKIILVCGDLFDYNYVIEDINRDETTLRFVSKTKNKANPKTNLVVFQAIIKLDNLALIVEKLNELGVSEFVPFISANSNIRHINTAKLQTIANQSCKQCGRSVPLKVHEVHSFDEMLEELGAFENAFYADRGEKSRAIGFNDLNGTAYNAIVVGPEGGLGLDENLRLATEATPITLGKRTLRAETAAITAATIVLHYLGEV